MQCGKGGGAKKYKKSRGKAKRSTPYLLELLGVQLGQHLRLLQSPAIFKILSNLKVWCQIVQFDKLDTIVEFTQKHVLIDAGQSLEEGAVNHKAQGVQGTRVLHLLLHSAAFL